MKQYLELLNYIIENGESRGDRTGTGVISSFGHQIRFNLEEGFPAVTTKSLAWKGVVSELLWFLEGSDDERRLAEIRFQKDRGELTDLEKFSTIWTDNADNQGADLGYENTPITKKLGPIYGVQWRDWDGIDQIAELIKGLKENPNSRRHIVLSWNVGELDQMTLPPCHYSFQCYVNDEKLSLMWSQRSVDTFLGLPYNIASYGMLLLLLCQETGYGPGELIGNLGDTHLYSNHIEQAKLQLTRSRELYDLPTVKLSNVDILNGEFDYELINYKSHPKIKAPLSN